MAERRSGMDEVTEKLNEISTELKLHIASDAETGRKTAEMYKVLVTGNGVPSLQERTRGIENWIGTEKKIVWFIGAIVAADVVTRLWALITP
jgi:hypothetical protein